MDEARRRIAHELRAAIDYFPALVLNEATIADYRTPRAPSMPMQPMPDALMAVRCDERFVPARAGAPDVRILLYQPANISASVRPAYLHIHGGGYVLGQPEINDLSNRMIVATLGCTILSVGYRLAPETVFPGARDDRYAALAWLHDHAAELGVDPARIAVGGESAGGGHAVALALHARDIGAYPICFLLLDSPMLDDRTGSSAPAHPICGQWVWTAEQNRFGWRAMLGQEPGTDDVPAEAVPARCADVGGLPPTFLSVGALDLFLDENLEFARRLARAGVSVDLHVTAGAYHGFGMAGPEAPQVLALQAMRMSALERGFSVDP